MSMPGAALPEYPKAGGATLTRLDNARKRYGDATVWLDRTLETVEQKFAQAFEEADARAATRARLRTAAQKSRQNR